MTRSSPPLAPRIFGLAGLLPQAIAVAVQIAGDPAYVFLAQALGFAYAALILSFLGGLWWGLAARGDAPGWVYGVAVVPSLFALATALPWALGWAWPGPSSSLLGLAILATPLVDGELAARGLVPGWWMRLRWTLSIGLGGLTLASGLMS